MKELVIAGNGGFAREAEWLVKRINAVNPTWRFLGFIDNDNDAYIVNQKNELYVAIAIGTSGIREKIYKEYRKNPHIHFANLIDPSVIYSNRIFLGEGNIICAGTVLTVDITIGNCCIINLDCTIGHDTVMGDFVTINPGVNISGRVHIESGCNIGTGTRIIQGLKVGMNTIVGAGAVVNKDLPENCTAVGVPAKCIKTREGSANE